jgi:hypothetical protein
MTKQTGTLKTLVLQIVLLLLIAGCTAATIVKDEPVAATAAPVISKTTEERAQSPAPASDEPGCAAPDATDAARCRELEAEILAATVRLELKIHDPGDGSAYWSSIGHGTIIAGRYLLTHNHYNLSLQDFEDGRERTLSLYRPDGKPITRNAPLGTFTVTTATPETLVFDFGDEGGEGLFDLLGLRSAKMDAQQAARLRPGMEVAQVNWDGNTTYVDWVRIEAIREENGTRVLVLGNFAQPGASGGGVFYDGYHVANNWFRRTEESASGAVLKQYTAAALNAHTILTAAEGGGTPTAAGMAPEAGQNLGRGIPIGERS